MRRSAALGALVLVVTLVAAGCKSDDAASASRSSQSASATPSATPSAAASLPAETDAPPDPDDPALDPALSEPVEDSVYPDVGDPSVDSLHYDLDLAWTPDTRTLVGAATIELRSTSTSDHLQLDLGEPLEVSELTLDGAEVPFEHLGKNLVVSAPVTEDERYVLDVRYSGTPEPTPAPTTRRDFSTSGWTITPGGETWTMQEPYGAFTWYPVNDQPSDKAFYDISVTVPSPWVGIANGVLTDQTEHDGLTTTAWHLSAPASSYVVTVATGDYTRTTNTSQSGTEISYWVPSDRPGLAPGLEAAAEGLDWLEALLGPVPVRQPRLPARRLAQRHGDADHDHARRHRLHDVRGGAGARDGAPVVRRRGHARGLARRVDERGHGDVPPGLLAGRGRRSHRRRGDGRLRVHRGSAARGARARPRPTTRSSSATATSTTARH